MILKSAYITIFVAVSVFTVAIGFMYYAGFFSKQKKINFDKNLLVGKNFSFDNFTDTTKGNLKAEKDKKTHNHLSSNKTWVMYIVSSCDACHKQVAIANNLLKRNPDIQIIALMGENEYVLKKYIKEHQIKFPVLLDEGGTFFKKRGLKYFPTNFIVEEGVIRDVLVGLPDQEKLMEFIK